MGSESNGSDISNARDLLFVALTRGASTIHLTPTSTDLRVRFRVNGKLLEQKAIQSPVAENLLKELKELAHLSQLVPYLPEHGPIRYKCSKLSKEIRANYCSLPSLNGRTIVITFNQGESIRKFDQLGMEEAQIRSVKSLVQTPGRMLLVTGPWASGKTATLYVMAREMAEVVLSVFSLEDPIESALEGVTQVQVSRLAGMGFSAAMSAVLRNDPDVIVLGELSSYQEAKMALEACLYGRHRVICGLHSENTVECLNWFSEHGFSPRRLASILSGVIVQRLVRRVCKNCETPCELTPALMAGVGFSVQARGPWVKGQGCEKCNGTGYLGKTGIFEVTKMDQDLMDAVTNNVNVVGIKRALRAQQSQTVRRAGIAKAELGITTVEEVIRVTT